ncbi:MAG: M48 family metallopeptidase [Clostridiales bacterium]|nr:M48 family metallopeptidase [Clostridiales bacterium]
MKYDYNILRSDRKTVSIAIKDDCRIEVRAPLKMSDREIEKLVLSKEKWIEKHLKDKLESRRQSDNFSLDIGGDLMFRGKVYQLYKSEYSTAGFDGEKFYVPEFADSEIIRESLIKVYKKLAEKLIKQRVREYSKIMALSPSNVKINSAKTRWGSCSGKNSLNFSLYLVLGSDEIIDYVVVHELAHIKEHNHSNRFWAVVESVLPDYRKRQKELIALQKRIGVYVKYFS